MKDLLEDNAGYVLIPRYRVFIVVLVHEYLGWLFQPGAAKQPRHRHPGPLTYAARLSQGLLSPPPRLPR